MKFISIKLIIYEILFRIQDLCDIYIKFYLFRYLAPK